tara:strand:- start:245 stop:346 length:102 start_codon:yes stop_codon:yes gene_type:complete
MIGSDEQAGCFKVVYKSKLAQTKSKTGLSILFF